MPRSLMQIAVDKLKNPRLLSMMPDVALRHFAPFDLRELRFVELRLELRICFDRFL